MSAVLPQGKFVFDRFPGFYVGLRETADAVHPIGEIKPMPVNGCGDRQPVRHVDSHPFAFDGLDHGAVYAAVVSPALGAQTRSQMRDRLLRQSGEKLSRRPRS